MTSVLAGPLAPHVCGGCGTPQPIDRSRDDYFAVLGVSRAFAQEPAALERRFYELSRALHPDRFTTAGLEARAASVERMSLLNQAYTTLRDPRGRREYLLELEGVKSPAGGQSGQGEIPLELAERWFELQEQLMEGEPAAVDGLREFRGALDGFRGTLAGELAALEREHDAATDATVRRAALERLSRRLQAENYLVSLERNIARWVK